MRKFIGKILLAEAAFLVPAMLISLFFRETKVVVAFLETLVLLLIVSGILLHGAKDAKRGFYAREGMVCVGMSWIIMSILGCFPFFFSGAIPNYIDALFEMVSGFTTTGASILPEVESMPKGLLYWRSFSHWVGGMGVLVFLLAVSGGDERS